MIGKGQRVGEKMSVKVMDANPKYPLVKVRIIRKVDNNSLIAHGYRECWKELEYLEYCLAHFSGTQNFQKRIDTLKSNTDDLRIQRMTKKGNSTMILPNTKRLICCTTLWDAKS